MTSSFLGVISIVEPGTTSPATLSATPPPPAMTSIMNNPLSAALS